jgi:hypothetical protein
MTNRTGGTPVGGRRSREPQERCVVAFHVRRWVVAIAITGLALGGCQALEGAPVSAEQRTWCLEHSLPDTAGGPSVAASARDLGIASPEVEGALAAFDATSMEGARLLQAALEAEVSGDAAAIEAARDAYLAWQAESAAPARAALARAIGGWSTTAEWADACVHAFDRRGTATGTPPPTLPPAGPSAEPTEAPTLAPTEEPTPEPTLQANKTITFTSSTSVGRLIELTIKVKNPGPLKAGTLSAQVEGVDYSIESRTPVVGCVPDCRSATGAEGIAYIEWPAPAPGRTRSYTVQLKAKRSGTYDIEVRAYRGPSEDPLDELASWSISVRVR